MNCPEKYAHGTRHNTTATHEGDEGCRWVKNYEAFAIVNAKEALISRAVDQISDYATTLLLAPLRPDLQCFLCRTTTPGSDGPGGAIMIILATIPDI